MASGRDIYWNQISVELLVLVLLTKWFDLTIQAAYFASTRFKRKDKGTNMLLVSFKLVTSLLWSCRYKGIALATLWLKIIQIFHWQRCKWNWNLCLLCSSCSVSHFAEQNISSCSVEIVADCQSYIHLHEDFMITNLGGFSSGTFLFCWHATNPNTKYRFF